MSLESEITRMEKLLGVDCESRSQCPHSERFLRQYLLCPDGGCRDGCQRAKEILLQGVALMGSRLRSEEWQV